MIYIFVLISEPEEKLRVTTSHHWVLAQSSYGVQIPHLQDGDRLLWPQGVFGCLDLPLNQTNLGLKANSAYASHWNSLCLSFST